GMCARIWEIKGAGRRQGFMDITHPRCQFNETKAPVLQSIERLGLASISQIAQSTGLSLGTVSGCIRRCSHARVPYVLVEGQVILPAGKAKKYKLTVRRYEWLTWARVSEVLTQQGLHRPSAKAKQ